MEITDLKTYYYDLPEELIAQTPIEPRDASRLLCFNKTTEKIEHKHFYDVIDYLNKGDVLVVNNTKVIPARIFGTKIETAAKVETLLLKKIDINHWQVLLKPAKRLKIGTMIEFSSGLNAEVVEKFDGGLAVLKFNFKTTFEQELDKVGIMPLPHYIHEKLKDKTRYNTVYSKIEGSAAAPTAGLHFTPELLKKTNDKGIKVVEVLLQIGLGTFRPVMENNILNHKMHSEHIEITQDAINEIENAKKNGNKVVAVGTTSVRTLESFADENGKLHAGTKETDIFIYPGYKFKVVDAIITNFHLPESTLIMLISSFIGIEQTMKIYNLAVKEKYRFYSFGDAMILYDKKEQ